MIKKHGLKKKKSSTTKWKDDWEIGRKRLQHTKCIDIPTVCKILKTERKGTKGSYKNEKIHKQTICNNAR